MPRDENDVSDSELDEEKLKTKEDPRNPAVYELYRTAAQFSNQALDHVISLAVPGASVTDLCAAGDAKMEELCKTVFSKATMTRGVAFPTCVSVNHVVGSFSPLRSADPQLLAVGDVVKFDMGAHLDGYASTVAHTIIVGATADAPVTDRRADVLAAAEAATQAVLRLLKPGNSTRQLTAAVQKVAAQFDCRAIQGVYSHEVNRFVLEGEACFPGCEADAGSALAAEEAKREDFEIAVNQVWAVDVVLSTGTGKSHSIDARTTIYRRAQDKNYSVKLKSSKTVLADINRRFPDFPFSLRSFANEGATRLGITELTNHQLVDAYPVMSEKPGHFVAHLKFTALMMPNGFVKVTGRSIDTSAIKSSKAVTDPELLALLSQPIPSTKSLKAGGKKKKKAAKAVGADGAAAAAADDEEEAPALAK